ncbi:MAG TPA: hypothetical protein VF818_11435 [Ktedonobacterales bacterium]
MSAVERQAASPRIATRRRAYWYAAYGLRVRSDVRLPVGRLAPGRGALPDVIIRRHDGESAPTPDGPAVAEMPCPVHGTEMVVYRGAGGTWIWRQATGVFHVAPDARRIDVYPERVADEEMLGHTLIQPVLLYVLHRRGHPSLHASAMLTDCGVVAFLGQSGQGKSTMTAAFLRRGAMLLTDDALALRALEDGVYAIPGPAHMKLCRETAEHTLALADTLPKLAKDARKHLLALDGRYPHARTPERLRALYVLRRYEPETLGQTDIIIQPLSARESLTALLAFTFTRACLLPREEAAFLPLYAQIANQTPMRVLTYPSGFEHQEAVCNRVLADLEDDV